jgi:menaquinone-dependent protoporphyrinogen oxidase
MTSILIIYSTTDGQTLKICQRLQTVIERYGDSVTLVDINEAHSADLGAYDKIVIGASIRYGKHSPAVHAFINSKQALLESVPSAFFSVNVVARKPHKRQPDTNPYVRKFLQQISWKPKNLAVFAGRIDYQRYSFWDRNIIRMIMWITNGPTDPTTNIEFTDWDQVDAFGHVVSKMH